MYFYNQSHRFGIFALDPFLNQQHHQTTIWFSFALLSLKLEAWFFDFNSNQLFSINEIEQKDCTNKTKTQLLQEKKEGDWFCFLTSQCQPPRPTAFLTTPWRPTRTDFVRLFPVTTTFVWRGSTVSSSSLLLQSPKQLCSWVYLSAASSILFFFSFFFWTEPTNLDFSRFLKWKLTHYRGGIEQIN